MRNLFASISYAVSTDFRAASACGGDPIGVVGFHSHRDITDGLCLVDGKRKFIAIDGRIDVIGRRKPGYPACQRKAVVAEMVLRVVYANVKENSNQMS
jgi:hypothetical protein